MKRFLNVLVFLVPQRVRRGLLMRLLSLLKQKLKSDLQSELIVELKKEILINIDITINQAIMRQRALPRKVESFLTHIDSLLAHQNDLDEAARITKKLIVAWRVEIRRFAGLPDKTDKTAQDLILEVSFLSANAADLLPVFTKLRQKTVLFAGQAYYNAWYLSRALRLLGWDAFVLNWDEDPKTQIYYHGEDFKTGSFDLKTDADCLSFYVASIYDFEIFHFSNAHGISFGQRVSTIFNSHQFEANSEIRLLKYLGKKIIYSNNGCLDGVSQTAFSKWGTESICSICVWRNVPSVCSDERNLGWGKFRNSVADYQCLLGGNRIDYNEAGTVHEVPEFYCLDSNFWHPYLVIPSNFKLPEANGVIRLYHAVAHKADRTSDDGVNIKSSHVYLPLMQRLVDEGLPLELIEPTGIPNKDVRYLQAQADIFLEMLSYGWFGANAREAMMLGKPVICYIRPEWLASLREELPEYADELPIISATPDTVEGILRELIANAEMRREVGARSRVFAVKWHSSDAAGIRFDDIYSRLLQGDALLRQSVNKVIQ